VSTANRDGSEESRTGGEEVTMTKTTTSTATSRTRKWIGRKFGDWSYLHRCVTSVIVNQGERRGEQPNV
jgi:hypothetical protein